VFENPKSMNGAHALKGVKTMQQIAKQLGSTGKVPEIVNTIQAASSPRLNGRAA
jgi:hypothetical protein